MLSDTIAQSFFLMPKCSIMVRICSNSTNFYFILLQMEVEGKFNESINKYPVSTFNFIV